MRRSFSVSLVALMLLACSDSRAAQSEAIDDDGRRTLQGDWQSGGWGDGDVEAVFTPTGDDTWAVEFHFTFDGTPHTYSGVAEGSLSDGPLTGEVRNENRRRTFTFDGHFEDGVFEGEHAEVRRAKPRPTGRLTLG